MATLTLSELKEPLFQALWHGYGGDLSEHAPTDDFLET